ncbi:MAG TPA: FtsQ-type POTRA domain-containing protein [Candidatus Limnocylindrales bacterium]
MRRASAGLTPVRAGALLALLAAIAGLYGVATTGAFTVQRTSIEGATWTPEQEILAALAIPADQNAFALRAAALEARVLGIPSVRTAAVTVALPDEVRVAITEREPVMVWQVGSRRFLVDASGLLFGELDDTGNAGTSLPVIADDRAASAGFGVGSTLDPVTLDSALRLGSLVPADIGSAATSLDIRVGDEEGFVVRGRPAGWAAVFGFYTPTLRTTELIPGQVRLLRSLLLGREENVLKVILADDRSGTYVPRATPKASATPKP